MISGGRGTVTQASYKDAATRVLEAAEREFEVTPNRQLHSDAMKAAMVRLEKAGKIDATSMREALEAARSVFIKAGFDQRAFATKFGAKGDIAGMRQFRTDGAAEYTKDIMKSGEQIVLFAHKLMGKPADEAGPDLARVIKEHLA